MPESYYDTHFPNLKRLGFRKTSDPDYYNCIAYVVGDFDRKWWPGEYPPRSGDYWPIGIRNDETLEAFTQAFSVVGFSKCRNGKLEAGFTKIALYAVGQDITHAAIQKENGWWSSKLGPDEDIEHTLAGLEGPLYGKVVAFFKKEKDATSERPGCLYGIFRILAQYAI